MDDDAFEDAPEEENEMVDTGLSLQDRVRAIARDSSLNAVEKTQAIQQLYAQASSAPSEQVAEEEEQTRAPECNHYVRGCDIRASCCNKLFGCRLCHDEHFKEHKIDRFSTTQIRCRKCGTDQPVSNRCTSCDDEVFGVYFCAVCRLWTDRDTFHCEECGICRAGRREDYVHCQKCGGCVAPSHKCIHSSNPSNTCPVCLEVLFDSVKAWVPTKCGHQIHQECLMKCHQSHNFRCPICKKSMFDMNWEEIAALIQIQPMPEEFSDIKKDIVCNDCGTHSKDVPFHFLGCRCSNSNCGSFNTQF